MGMRGLETPVRKIRRQVFREVAKVAFESTSENLIEEIEEIPYRLVTEDGEKYRDSMYPVSYTHLDVYKRQVYNECCGMKAEIEGGCSHGKTECSYC